MDHKVHHSVAVAKFTVIPRNEIDRVVIEDNGSSQHQRWRSLCHC